MHDLGAELQGYKDELATVDGDRAKAVRGEIDRVSKAIEERATGLDEQGSKYDAAGQDVPAAEARVEARRYRALLAEDDNVPAEETTPKGRKPRGTAGKQDTAAAKPPEKS
jgi:hypothetical protein